MITTIITSMLGALFICAFISIPLLAFGVDTDSVGWGLMIPIFLLAYTFIVDKIIQDTTNLWDS